MKPIFEKVPKQHERSIFINHYPKPVLEMPYHYHPEFEIAFTKGRSGKRFVGNSVEEIAESDLVLLGKNLPHCFIGNHNEKDRMNDYAELIVLQFHFEIFGDHFLDMPETMAMRQLAKVAQRGLFIREKDQEPLIAILFQMLEVDPMKRIALLLELLTQLAQLEDYKVLSSKSFERQYYNQDYHRITEIYNFIIQNFKAEISLKEAAKVANLSETAFCRYFKQRTSKTFKEVVNEMRISYACDLIINGRMSTMTVSQIAREAGFNNLSNFNRQFRKVTGLSPGQYAKEFYTRAVG
ncbi:MAG: AraC family transcriptional regulator [Bacteroidota bacterium]